MTYIVYLKFARGYCRNKFKPAKKTLYDELADTEGDEIIEVFFCLTTIWSYAEAPLTEYPIKQLRRFILGMWSKWNRKEWARKGSYEGERYNVVWLPAAKGTTKTTKKK